MKSILSSGIVIIFFIISSGFTVSADKKINQFKFTISNIQTQADCDKIDNMMKSRKGVLESKTELATKTITVKAESQITFEGLVKVVAVCGFEASESYQLTDITSGNSNH